MRSRKRRGTVDDSVLRAAIAQREQGGPQDGRLPPAVRLPGSEQWDMSPAPSDAGSPVLRPARAQRRPSLRGRRDSEILDPDVSNWVDDDVFHDDGSPAVMPMRGQSPSPMRSRRSSLAGARECATAGAQRDPVASSGSASAHSFRTDSFQLPREASGQQGTVSTPTSQGSRVPFFAAARHQNAPGHPRAVASASSLGPHHLHVFAGHSMRRASAPGTGPLAMGLAGPNRAGAPPPAIPEDGSVGSQGGVSHSMRTSQDADEGLASGDNSSAPPDRTSQGGRACDGPKEESWSDEEVAESSESDSPLERESSQDCEPPSAHASSMAAVTGRAAWDSVPTLSTLGLEMPDQPRSPQDSESPRRRQRSGSVHEDAPARPRRRRGGSFSHRDKPLGPPPRVTRPVITPTQLIRARSMLAIAPSDRQAQPSQPRRWTGVTGRASMGHSVSSRHSLALPHTRHLLSERGLSGGGAGAAGPVLAALPSLPRSVSFSLKQLHPVDEDSTPRAPSTPRSDDRPVPGRQPSPSTCPQQAVHDQPDVFEVARLASRRAESAAGAPTSAEATQRQDKGAPEAAASSERGPPSAH